MLLSNELQSGIIATDQKCCAQDLGIVDSIDLKDF